MLASLQLLVGRTRLAHATARPVRDVARLGRGTDVMSRFPATGQTRCRVSKLWDRIDVTRSSWPLHRHAFEARDRRGAALPTYGNVAVPFTRAARMIRLVVPRLRNAIDFSAYPHPRCRTDICVLILPIQVYKRKLLKQMYIHNFFGCHYRHLAIRPRENLVCQYYVFFLFIIQLWLKLSFLVSIFLMCAFFIYIFML